MFNLDHTCPFAGKNGSNTTARNSNSRNKAIAGKTKQREQRPALDCSVYELLRNTGGKPKQDKAKQCSDLSCSKFISIITKEDLLHDATRMIMDSPRSNPPMGS